MTKTTGAYSRTPHPLASCWGSAPLEFDALGRGYLLAKHEPRGALRAPRGRWLRINFLAADTALFAFEQSRILCPNAPLLASLCPLSSGPHDLSRFDRTATPRHATVFWLAPCSTARKSAWMKRILSVLLLCASALFALAHCSKKLHGKFVAMAKLVVQHRIMVEPVPGHPHIQEHTGDLYGTIIETLESAEMIRRAWDRLRALQPDLEECEVDIQGSMNEGSTIIQVRGFGDDPIYTQAFLNALLDEYMAFRQSSRDGIVLRTANLMAEELVRREKIFAEKSKDLAEFSQGTNPPLLPAENQRLIQRVIKMRDIRDDLDWQIKTGDTSAETAKKRDLATKEIEMAEARIKEAGLKLASWKKLEADYEEGRENHDELLFAIRTFQLSADMSGDNVVILERASKAIALP